MVLWSLLEWWTRYEKIAYDSSLYVLKNISSKSFVTCECVANFHIQSKIVIQVWIAKLVRCWISDWLLSFLPPIGLDQRNHDWQVRARLLYLCKVLWTPLSLSLSLSLSLYLSLSLSGLLTLILLVANLVNTK